MTFRSRHNSITSFLPALVLGSFFALGLGFGPLYSAQRQPQPQKPTETVARIETELVQIDVVVTNRAGKLVGDLKREDFQIIEDGKSQAITHFAVGNSIQPAVWLTTERRRPATLSSSGTSNTTTATSVELRGRFIVLAVDDLHLSPQDLLFAKRTLHTFVRDQLEGGDQTAIATTSGALGLFQQFTNDRSVLTRAIDRLYVQQRSAMTPLFDVPQISDYQAELIDIGDQDALELAIQEILRQEMPQSPAPSSGGGGGAGSRGPGGGGGGASGESMLSARERAAQNAKGKARMIVSENASVVNSALISLEGIVRSLRDLPGRKLVILISDGFFMGGSSSAKHFDVRKITDAATRAGVVMYSIDARGLIATPPGGDASTPSQPDVGMPGARSRIEMGAADAKRDGLNALARDTGGFLVVNTNDLNAGIQRVLAENETYYVLAWEPEMTYRDGRFRKIDVKIPNRPELRVRTRKGYFAPDDKEKLEKERAEAKIAEMAKENPSDKSVRAAKEAQLRAGLVSLFPLRSIPIDLTADFIDNPEVGQVAIVTAHVDAGTLNFTVANDAHTTSIDVVTLVFDEKGKVTGNISDRLNLNLKPQLVEQVRRTGFTYRKLVPLKPGFHQVRLAIREEISGQVGSASRWVEVPDMRAKKLTLSSILLTTSLREVQRAEKVEYEPRPTQALRQFKTGTNVDFLVFAYNAQIKEGKSDIVLQAQVYSGSKLIYSSPLSRIPTEDMQDPLRIPYAARLSLTGFNAGEYELRVVVIDRLAVVTADRRVSFAVGD